MLLQDKPRQHQSHRNHRQFRVPHAQMHAVLLRHHPQIFFQPPRVLRLWLSHIPSQHIQPSLNESISGTANLGCLLCHLRRVPLTLVYRAGTRLCFAFVFSSGRDDNSVEQLSLQETTAAAGCLPLYVGRSTSEPNSLSCLSAYRSRIPGHRSATPPPIPLPGLSAGKATCRASRTSACLPPAPRPHAPAPAFRSA